MLKGLLRKKRNSRKLCIVGLDGVPCTLLKEYMDKGYLPSLSRILDGGFRLHQMDASIPDVSSTSWTSFMTGVNPAEHGIYGFMDLRPGGYELFFPNSSDIKAPALWDIAGKRVDGKTSTLAESYGDRLCEPLRSVVLNIPQTYPARPLNGLLTAGFVCPDLRKGTYPDSLYRYLDSIGYLSDVDATRAVSDADGFFRELFEALEKRRIAYEHLMRNEEWDLFIGVVTETDRLHHFFFHAARDDGDPRHRVFVDLYREIDSLVGSLFDTFMDMTGGEGFFMTMSDHGFTTLEREFYINAWLRREGFLKLDPSGSFYEQVAAGTRAFALDPARIYINVEGRYPRSGVAAADRDAVKSELKSLLSEIRHSDGRKVVREIYDGDEIYDGPMRASGPDLVCLPSDGFDIKGALKKDEPFGKGHFTGMHTSYDAHCVLPEGARTPERLQIENLAWIALEYLAGRGA
ncbi:MAG TPA: hypothetical protein ENJ37_06260 [Deltaproteobacteria bacterium]|nr:hypothetical protein [Deltaproteobacteria bacterium]